MPSTPTDPSTPIDTWIMGLQQRVGAFGFAAESTKMPVMIADAAESAESVIFANAAFLQMTGLQQDDVLAAPLDQVLNRLTDAGAVASIRQVMATGHSGTWDMQCRRPDRSDFFVKVYVVPLHTPERLVSHHFFSFVALQDHVDNLLRHRDELNALYEHVPAFIATGEGPGHRFTFANAAYKKFVGRDHLVGLTVLEALPELAEQGIIELLDGVYQTGEPFVGEQVPMNLIDKVSGQLTTRYCNFVYQAVRNDNDEITGMFCAGYDVTAQRETADALATVQAELIHVSRVNAMGTMATTLAHELNQPLSAITNYSAGLLRLVDPATKESERLAMAVRGIGEATQRAADIIRHVRDLTGRRLLKRVEFALQPAVDECVRLVMATVPPTIRISHQIPEDLHTVGDRLQIQQVIINLLRNACDALADAEQKSVTVTADIAGDDIVVCVIDTGKGVSEEAARNMFSWTESTKEGGMGLGLSICRTIIDTHRGRIWLDQSSVHGSTFCFSVPLAPNS